MIRHRAIWFVIEMESMGNTSNTEFREWVFGKCGRLREARGKRLTFHSAPHWLQSWLVVSSASKVACGRSFSADPGLALRRGNLPYRCIDERAASHEDAIP